MALIELYSEVTVKKYLIIEMPQVTKYTKFDSLFSRP